MLPSLIGSVRLSNVQVSLQRLVKMLQVKGRGVGFDLSSAVVPVVDVTALIESEAARPGYISRGGAEDAADLFFATIQQPAAFAAPDQRIQLWNPADSGVVLKVEKFFVGQGTNGTISLDVVTAALSQLSAATLSGPVVFGGPEPKAQGRFNVALDAAPPIIKVIDRSLPSYPNTQAFDMLHGYPVWLQPGHGLCWRNIGGSLTGNQWVSAKWRELPR